MSHKWGKAKPKKHSEVECNQAQPQNVIQMEGNHISGTSIAAPSATSSAPATGSSGPSLDIPKSWHHVSSTSITEMIIATVIGILALALVSPLTGSTIGSAVSLSVVVFLYAIAFARRFKLAKRLQYSAMALIAIWAIAAIVHKFSPSKTITNQVVLLQTPQEPAFHVRLEEITVGVGQFGWMYRRDELQRERKYPEVGLTTSPLAVYMEGDRLYVDADLASGNRKSVKVKHSNVVRLPDGWDVNYDATAMEVVNKKLIPVFQIQQPDDDDLFISGLFYGPPDVTVVVSEKCGYFRTSDEADHAKCLARLFKYPGKENRGQRVR